MIVFWIITAVMILIALAFIAPSLLRESQLADSDRDKQNVVIARERLAELKNEHAAGSLSEEEYEQTKLELEQALLIDLDSDADSGSDTGGAKRGPLVLLFSTLFVVVATISVYLYLGTPQLIDREAVVAQQPDKKLPSIEEMMTTLVARLEENPEDAEGWYLLGRTHMALKDYQQAATAFDKLNKLVGDQPSILLALADALAMAAGGDMQGRPADLIRRAITLAPEDQTALWLAGMVESQAGNPALALQYWRHLKPKLAGDPDATRQVDRLIAATEGQLGSSGASSAPEEAAAAPATPSGAVITAHITLSAELAARVKPEESLFIYARALTGPKMPLAAVRMKAGDLPATIELNEAQAMVPGMSLARFPQVVVGARISRSGNAIAASGDLLGEVSPVTVSDSAVLELVIDSVVP